ncbi:MAG: lipopolysaccharide assembly protein LapA domain-containing protein [Microthrixaceae bacterium]
MVHIDRPRREMAGGDRPGTSGTNKVELIKRFGPSGLLAILLLWFVLANTQSVEVRWLFMSKDAPLFLVLALTALLSSLITLLMSRRGRRAKSSDRASSKDKG